MEQRPVNSLVTGFVQALAKGIEQVPNPVLEEWADELILRSDELSARQCLQIASGCREYSGVKFDRLPLLMEMGSKAARLITTVHGNEDFELSDSTLLLKEYGRVVKACALTSHKAPDLFERAAAWFIERAEEMEGLSLWHVVRSYSIAGEEITQQDWCYKLMSAMLQQLVNKQTDLDGLVVANVLNCYKKYGSTELVESIVRGLRPAISMHLKDVSGSKKGGVNCVGEREFDRRAIVTVINSLSLCKNAGLLSDVIAEFAQAIEKHRKHFNPIDITQLLKTISKCDDDQLTRDIFCLLKDRIDPQHIIQLLNNLHRTKDTDKLKLLLPELLPLVLKYRERFRVSQLSQLLAGFCGIKDCIEYELVKCVVSILRDRIKAEWELLGNSAINRIIYVGSRGQPDLRELIAECFVDLDDKYKSIDPKTALDIAYYLENIKAVGESSRLDMVVEIGATSWGSFSDYHIVHGFQWMKTKPLWREELLSLFCERVEDGFDRFDSKQLAMIVSALLTMYRADVAEDIFFETGSFFDPYFPENLVERVVPDWLPTLQQDKYLSDQTHVLLRFSRVLERGLDLFNLTGVNEMARSQQRQNGHDHLHQAYRDFHGMLAEWAFTNAKKAYDEEWWDTRRVNVAIQYLRLLGGNKLFSLVLEHTLRTYSQDETHSEFLELRSYLKGLGLLSIADESAVAKCKRYFELQEQLYSSGDLLSLDAHAELETFNFKSIQDRLAPNTALLYLVDLQTYKSPVRMPSGEHRLLGILIGRNRLDEPFYKLFDQRDELQAWSEVEFRISQNNSEKKESQPGNRNVGGYRDSPGGLVWLYDPVDLSELTQLVRESLWNPMASLLNGVTELHIVTQGRMHTMPYELGCPVERVTHFPGMAFYYRRYHQPESFARILSGSRPSVKRISAWGYSAPNDNPIPMVDAEIHLIQSIVEERCNVASSCDEALASSDIAFLCTHGEEDKQHPDSPFALLTGSDGGEKVCWGFDEAISLEKCPGIVVLSACVAGTVQSDAQGDPMGLVGALLLRGAHYVVGALQPVEDYYMPLLTGLFLWECVHRPQPVVDALVMAKQRLKKGDWPGGFEEKVRVSYNEMLHKWLYEIESSEGQELAAVDKLSSVVTSWPGVDAEVFNAELRKNRHNLLKYAILSTRTRWIQKSVEKIIKERDRLPINRLVESVRVYGG